MKKSPSLCCLAVGGLVALRVLTACHEAGPPVPARDAAVSLAAAQAAAPTAFPAAAMDAHLASYGRHYGAGFRFSGYVVVEQRGKIIYERGVCCADAAGTLTPNLDTNFAVASLSKQFTSAAILRLVEQGKLSLDEPIGTYLPRYPSVGRKLTLRQLLTHTAGLPNHFALREVYAARANPTTPARLLATFARRPLEFVPGSRAAYSNAGYVVLAQIIEAVSGQAYGEYLQANLFTPAGLTRTRVGAASELGNRAAGFTVGAEGARVRAPQIDPSVLYGAADVRSTARDLLAWVACLRAGTLLSHDSWLRMITATRGEYALGWRIWQIDGKAVIAHQGALDGTAVSLWLVPEADLVILAWSNNDTIDADAVVRAAFAGANGQPIADAPELQPATVQPPALARLLGTYVRVPDARQPRRTLYAASFTVAGAPAFELAAAGALLRLHTLAGGNVYLAPTSATTFRTAAGSPQLTFAERTATVDGVALFERTAIK